MRTTSEPASHRCVLGFYQGEMKARVDCGYADPPCVSALLCRCSRTEHQIGARWWKKESNLPVPMDPTRGHGACGWITHGILRDRERRLGPLIDKET